ncbi:MAG: hypothetical protein ACJ8LG_02780, partial [Massilia sp.]
GQDISGPLSRSSPPARRAGRMALGREPELRQAQIASAGVANLNLNGIDRYSGFAPNGFNGRYYYAKAAYAW